MKRIIFLLVCFITCSISIAQISISKQSKIIFKKQANINGSFISHSLADKSGNVWFTTLQGIYCYDGNSFTIYSIMVDLKEAYVYGVMQDKIGNIWFATNDGAYKFDGKSLAKFQLQNNSNWFLNPFGNYNNPSVSNQNNVKPNEVRKIIQDKDGNIFIRETKNTFSMFSPLNPSIAVTKGRLAHLLFGLGEDRLDRGPARRAEGPPQPVSRNNSHAHLTGRWRSL